MVIAEPVDTRLVILEPTGRLTAETVDEFNQTVSKWVRRGWHDLHDRQVWRHHGACCGRLCLPIRLRRG